MKNLVICFLLCVGLLFAQAPVTKPQPSEQTYGVGELYLFKTYTRDSYMNEFGVQPPPFNPNKPAKTWFDKTVTTATKDYWTVDLNKLEFIKLVLSKEDAATVNLPGSYRYDPYVVKPSECVRWIPGVPIPPTRFNDEILSERSEAEAIAQEVGGTVRLATTDGGSMAGTATKCGEGDTRNIWEVVTSSEMNYAGYMMKAKYANGIGAPGKWEGLNWIPSQIPTTTSNYMRVPVRTLLGNEQFRKTPMSTLIERTDLDPPGATGFLLRDRAKLDEILVILKELQSKIK